MSEEVSLTILSLLKENNEMLKEITAYINKIESPEYKQDIRNMDFQDNLAADLIGAMILRGSQNKLP